MQWQKGVNFLKNHKKDIIMQCFMLMSTLCETKNFESFLFEGIIFSLHISIPTNLFFFNIFLGKQSCIQYFFLHY